jgi:hypothetical protein
VWKARELEQRPRVRDAAASGKISLIQASAINGALDALPTRLDAAQRPHAEDLTSLQPIIFPPRSCVP